MNDKAPYVPPFVRRLMKDATEEETLEASNNLRRYVLALYATFLRKEERTEAARQIDRKQ